MRPLKGPAIYFQRGKTISHDMRVVTNAAGPSVGAVPPDPGTVVYAVSPDCNDYWLTMTTFRNPAGSPRMGTHCGAV